MEFNILLDFLSPVPGHETYDYVLYALFFLGMLTLTFMGSGNSQMDTIFITVSVFLVVLDKLYIVGFVFTPEGVAEGAEVTNQQRIDLHITHFVTYCMRVAIFVLPLVVAGNTKNPRTRLIAGFYAIIGFGYSFGRWFFEIRALSDDPTLGMAASSAPYMIAGGLMAFVLGDLAARYHCQNRKLVESSHDLSIVEIEPNTVK